MFLEHGEEEVEEGVVDPFNVKMYLNVIGLTVLVVILAPIVASQLQVTYGMLHSIINLEALPITAQMQRKREIDIVRIFVVVINLVS